jgi:peptide/nickel transport system ATP-binding protein
VSTTETLALETIDVQVELADGSPIIEGIDLKLRPGEILGLVGESGSGKTTLALSIFGYMATGLKRSSGEITVAGEHLDTDQASRRARGRLVSYVPQNPGTALNPSLRVAGAIEDILRAHGKDTGESSELPLRMFERVGLPGDHEFGRRFPHQLSGGQQQRVCIAGSLAPDPVVVVLDEPTTGLDVVTQDRILKELVRLRDEQGVAMLYITHDLAVVAEIANQIAVMYAGHVVEQGPASEILRHPQHPYTRGLMASTPDHMTPRELDPMPGIALGVGDRPAGCPFAPRCPQRMDRCDEQLPALEQTSAGHLVRCFAWEQTPPLDFRPPENIIVGEQSQAADAPQAPAVLEAEHVKAEYKMRHGNVVAASDISFRVERGGSVALVGESGSGKTTIARVIAGLHPAAAGQILLDGSPLPGLARQRTREQRRRIQIVFQNPAEALNPRHTVAESIARPARMLQGLDKSAAAADVTRLLESVRLPARLASRYPRELSGGERQRVAIARALAAGPEIMVCDEITSALDVSVQAVVLELLRDLRRDLGVAVIFITHDLGVVATVAERVLVLEKGVFCEEGRTADVLTNPQHPYTQRLLAAAPSLSAAIDARHENGGSPRVSRAPVTP